MNAANDELEKSADSCEFWGWLCAGLLGVGLLGELAIAASHPPYDSFLEQWGASLADALVFLGVAGEVQFGRMASRRQAELRRRSDTEIAEAKKRSAEANARAAEAALETERLRTQFGWRAISAGEMAILIRALARSIGPVIISFVAGDAESQAYAQQFVFAFRHAGWATSLAACTYAQIVFGLSVPERSDEGAEPSKALRAALREAGIAFDSAPVPNWEASTSWSFKPEIGGIVRPMPRFAEKPALLYIGPKAMPWAIPPDDMNSAAAAVSIKHDGIGDQSKSGSSPLSAR